MPPRYLIVRANDFGLCHAVNQAVLEAFETGVLTCASLAVAGPWVAEAASLARDHPEWEIGLQLSLTCDTRGCRWGPVVGAEAVPALVDPAGTFVPRFPADLDAEAVRRELNAQADRARSWGIIPAYLDYAGPEHPAVSATLSHLGEQLGVPVWASARGIRRLELSETGQGTHPAEQTRIDVVCAALRAMPPGGHFWATRPAHDSPEAWGLWPDEEVRSRQADASALCSAEVRATLGECGIELIGFRQQVDARDDDVGQ
jgi:predicted glycoside hydrolase/deacetylase ChbG (UPF0249 family)